MRWNHRDTRFAKMTAGQTLEKNEDRLDQMMKGEIDQALSRNELPAIGYDVSFLAEQDVKKPVSHWSTIVGRRRGSDGKCYYGIRNSWGKECQGYKPGVKCKNGYLLVSREDLLPRVHTVHAFID